MAPVAKASKGGRFSLIRTTALQLALGYATLFSLLMAVALAYIYLSTQHQIESQIDSRLRLETDVLINLHESGDPKDLLHALNQRSAIDRYGRFYYLFQANQAILEDPTRLWPDRLQSIRTHTTVDLSDVIELPEDSAQADRRVRLAKTQFKNGLVLLVGHDITDEQALLDHTFARVVFVSLITLALALISGVLAGYAVTRRIHTINSSIAEIMGGDLNQRVPTGLRRDEFHSLSEQVNAMLDRIAQLMQAMQQVTNNIAHDLRSPLNRLRNRLEVTLIDNRGEQACHIAMREAIDDADSVINTFNALLSIAKIEAITERGQWQHFKLADIVQDLAELYVPLAEESGIQLDADATDVGTIHANYHLLAQAITNLLDNALKYGGKHIRLFTHQSDPYISITVTDDGTGVPDEQKEWILKPFTRLEGERNTLGSGLGLSLVQAICRHHQAKLSLADNNPGLQVTISFTRAPDPIDEST